MRVLTVLVALVATPLVAAVAQSGPRPAQDPRFCGQHLRLAENAGKPVPVHNGRHGVLDYPCGVTDPPPPPPSEPPPPGSTGCVASAPAAAGSAAIRGGVFTDGWVAGLGNWCVELTGAVVATAVTDASGSYVFTGLPDGEYTVCEVLQSGWTQTFPRSGTPCPTGVGYTFSIVGGNTAWFVDFTNVAP